MAAADLAPLAIAPLVLVVLADLVFALGHLDRIGVPECECVDRAGGPAPAARAMAVAGACRIARDDDRDGTTEALPGEGLLVLTHALSLARVHCDLDRDAIASKGGRARRAMSWSPTSPPSARCAFAKGREERGVPAADRP